MDKTKYLEIVDLVMNHFKYDIERLDDRSKTFTVDVCKYLHSKNPTEMEIRDQSYLNYQVLEGQKVILSQIREEIRRILLTDINDNFKNT